MSRNEALLADLRRRMAESRPMREVAVGLSRGRVEITGTTVESRALALAALHEITGRPIGAVVPGESAFDDFTAALRLFHGRPESVSAYPAPSLSPYHEVPPTLAVIRDEIRTLGQLAEGSADLVTVPVRALFRLLPAITEFSSRLLHIEKGSDIDVKELLQRLSDHGFVRTDLVGEVGEFAFRGGILDVFAPSADQPVRIELFGDTIDSIRTFEVETQRSAETLDSFTIEPATHFPLTPPVRTALARRLSLDFADPLFKRDVAEKIERLTEYSSFPGVENYIPAAVPTATLLDYLRGAGNREWLIAVVEPDEVNSTIDKYDLLLRNEYENATAKGKAVYAPERIVVAPDRVREVIRRSDLSLTSLRVESRDVQQIALGSLEASRFVNRLGDLPLEIGQTDAAEVLFVATRGGREKVERLFKEFSIPYADDPVKVGAGIAVTDGNLARGFSLELPRIILRSEWDLFEPPMSARIGGRKKKASDAFLTDLRDLKPGDFIVHVDHGVARFHGLQRIPFGANEREVMELEYANSGKLLLPMENLNLIQKYSAGEDAHPKLDRLGGTSWARTKASVKKAMRDMADELLKLYATRQMVPGHAFSKDSPWQMEFEESFEFEETEDQESAIDDVKRDMESRKPMDRLLCGDVGYGKTEVAMRAAFKSVMDGKQVAVLAPTTILAYQHYRTFLRRFASFPVSIDLISRFRSAKEQKELAAKVSTGEVDLVIGTHRILSKDLQFRDLGLVVIDEEQRFGVAQKEKLKQLKKAVDVLAMSATPIPRTLHMSLVGIRDISVIETPPKDRLAIQTNVVPFDDEFIKEAIEFELERGGQVYFVHNRVDSIISMKDYLERLVPGVRVIIGHGQVDEKELEKRMMAFISREYDILLATTIIENGIDIPACNTILINHAEKFGLSQLYQLRGRVGRSDQLAFCYLLVPSNRILSSDARKRLAAIQEFSDLGAGFRIAARDLEIRGSGNLLGGEQSGQIIAVGFDMYCKLLDETIRELKGEKIQEAVETTINLGLDIYIPRSWVDDENLRMMFYKRIASASTPERLEGLRNEMRDRFGALPESVESLLAMVRLKLLASSLGVASIVREGDRVAVKFTPSARIDPNRLLSFLGEHPEARFTPSGALSMELSERGGRIIQRLEEILSGVSLAA
jgi:transcription-repair coupling factor (superfamily II helicase)